MSIDFFKRLLLFGLLCLAQVLVFNRIQLFHCAIPLLYVYFVLIFPRHYPKWAILLWSFAMGLSIDIFANTPGVSSASLTLVGALQPALLELFIPRDAEANIDSSASTLGWGKFFTLTTLLVLVFCLAFFSLEAFSFFNWQHWLLCVGSSTLLTVILIMTLETIRK